MKLSESAQHHGTEFVACSNPGFSRMIARAMTFSNLNQIGAAT
jgi:hypothetical protein